MLRRWEWFCGEVWVWYSEVGWERRKSTADARGRALRGEGGYMCRRWPPGDWCEDEGSLSCVHAKVEVEEGMVVPARRGTHQSSRANKPGTQGRAAGVIAEWSVGQRSRGPLRGRRDGGGAEAEAEAAGSRMRCAECGSVGGGSGRGVEGGATRAALQKSRAERWWERCWIPQICALSSFQDRLDR